MVDTMTIKNRRDSFCGKITAYLGEGKLTEIHSRHLVATVWWKCPTCKGYSAISAKMVLNTTFPFT